MRRTRTTAILALLTIPTLVMAAPPAATPPTPVTRPARLVRPPRATPRPKFSAADDPYDRYVRTSEDFQPVKQDKAWCLKAFPGWTMMPWPAHWGIGYNAESGKWCVDHGINGAVINGSDVGSESGPTGKLQWINQFHLRFYVDHLARKHYLHLWDGSPPKAALNQLHGNGVRPVPLNDALRDKLEDFIRHNVGVVKSSPERGAYALDDETSWGHFVHPAMWQITDDKDAYPHWLNQVYGPGAPQRTRWVTYDDIRPKLTSWTLANFDASPLMDQWSFNDSYWCNFLGSLVQFTNGLDPATPVGIVGAQNPSPFGGYDYAKLMRKVQFIEAYNMGSSQAIVRSFNPHNAIPSVTTTFHKDSADDIWQTWYYLAHGNRGFIGWVDGWFDGKTPKPWINEDAPTWLEAEHRISPLMEGAEWMHDGVAIYYSHASIQLGWIMDAEAHGKTWINRNGDDQLGASHRVRHAWENMLRDSGLQYNFISYADVIQHGVPSEYKVLILPACLCLSDAEARKIEAFCKAGGTVVADYLPGYWDQHGTGRPDGGALDAMFGISADPKLKAADLFNGTDALWCEVNQEANFSTRDPTLFMTTASSCIKDPSGFNKAIRNGAVERVNHYGAGTAVLLNLSPQWYNAYRAQGAGPASKRAVFMKPILDVVSPRVLVASANPRSPEDAFGAEVTCWRKIDPRDGKARLIYFVCQNPEIHATETGGGNSTGLKTNTVSIRLQFPRPVANVRDERTGKSLGGGVSFKFDWTRNQAVVLSVDEPRY